MFIALMDEEGFVAFACPANVAHRARVSVKAAGEALKILESPDTRSHGQDHEGRRIERVPGGWMVLNSAKYRDLVTREMMKEQTRIRVARHRAKQKDECNADVTLRNAKVTQSEADTDTKKEGANGSRPQSVEDWLRELEADKTYAGIDVRREYGKMLNWCKIRKKQATKRRFVNWLNNADKSLPLQHASRADYKRATPLLTREPTDEELAAHRAQVRELSAKLRDELKK